MLQFDRFGLHMLAFSFVLQINQLLEVILESELSSDKRYEAFIDKEDKMERNIWQ